MSETTLTGERIDSSAELYQVDLERHRAAYVFALERAAGAVTLDLGCGTGYGAAELAGAARHTVAIDRVRPGDAFRRESLSFVRADLAGVPLAADRFDLVVSFQVIEHLEDPTSYLTAIARAVKNDGVAILTTPNLALSDRENPFHVHEYESDELSRVLGNYFEDVEMLGVGMSPAVAEYQAQRLERIRRITRLDPLGLRKRLPRGLIDFLFARFSLLVRSGIRESNAGMPDVTTADYPVRPVDDGSLDLLAVCRRPRSRHA